jgi:hypothetical protein
VARRRRSPAGVTAGERGVAVAGDVVGSLIVTGDNVSVALQVGPEDGAVLQQLGFGQRPGFRKRSPLPPPGRFADHVDREAEAGELLAALAHGAVNIHGEAGVGKTYVVRDVGSRAGGDAARDGIAYLFARGLSREDLLQQVFDAFYEASPATRPSTAQLVRAMARRRPLLLLDSLELDREDAQALGSELTSSTIVVASTSRVLWDGRSLHLEGLGDADAEELVVQELGRALTDDERPAVAWLRSAFDGHPLRLRRAAAVARESRRPLALPPGAQPSAARRAVLDEAIAQLSGDERLVLAALVQLGGADVDSEQLGRILGANVGPELEKLRRLGLAEAHSPRYSASADVLADPGPLAELAPEAERRLLSGLHAWLDGRPPVQEVIRELPALVATVDLARRAGQPDTVIELGRAIDPALALSSRWDQWHDVLTRVRESARAAQDGRSEAWALHQLGTRAACVGETAVATATLREALQLRDRLGDEEGARLTAHNLEVALRRPPLLLRVWNRRLFKTPLWIVAAAIVAVLLLAAGAGFGVAAILDGDGPTETATLAIRFTGDGNGSVTVAPPGAECTGDCAHALDSGTDVALRAAADPGSDFGGWEGCPEPSEEVCDVALTGDVEVTVQFALSPVPTSTLNVSATNGRVTSGDGRIDCPGTCTAAFPTGSLAQLTAEPDEGFVLDRWDGCTESGATCEVMLDADKDVTAVFVTAPPPETVALTVAVVPTGGTGAPAGGSVRSGDGEIDCPTACSSTPATGSTITLTASPNDGYALERWEGCDSESESMCEVTLDEPRTVTAVFAAVPSTVTLTVGVVARGAEGATVGGTVTSDDGTIDCRGTCSGEFEAGTSVTLAAAADDGSVFDGWPDCPSPVGTSCTLTLDGDTKVTAVFRSPALEVTVSGGTVTYGPDGLVCPDTCTATFAAGTSITLNAASDDGTVEFTRVDWGGACADTPSSATTCSITVSEDTLVSADISGSG